MKVSSVKSKLPRKFFDMIEFDKFRPSQSKAIDRGLFDSKNMLICSPTASGKTFVAELAGIKKIIETGGKMIYIVPLKSLATEKAEEFKKYEEIGIKTSVSTGDPESSEPWLANADIIVCTSEKFDSLLRHNISWLNKINIAVFDEIHLINSRNRGPTLEVIITILKTQLKNVQLIGLSATIGNPKELSNWLNAELIEDDWRPVSLTQGIYSGNEIEFEKRIIPIEKIKNDETLSLALDTVNIGKQALIFCPTKRSTQSVARKIASLIKEKTNEDLAKKVKNSAGVATSQCDELSETISKGIAFHHSGLLSKQKKIVENGFKENKIKIICCTPTLAMGVNLPAFRVIMKSLKRFGKRGMDWIPVLEYHQMTGRAGRPKFNDTHGEAISIAKTQSEFEHIQETYVNGTAEDLTSKLGVEPVLRSVILSLISSGFIIKEEKLLEFFNETFYGSQYGNDFGFKIKILSALSDLEKFKFIKRINETIIPTVVGKRVSELYIYPDAAFEIINNFEKLNPNFDELSFLHSISSNMEMSPWLSLQKKDYEYIDVSLSEIEDRLIDQVPYQWEYEYDSFLKKTKTCFVLNEWINETNEKEIFEQYNVAPGLMRDISSRCEWLVYGASELAKVTGNLDKVNDISKLRVRMKNGVKSELLPLIRLKGIGRVRARRLFSSGYSSIKKLKTADIEKLSDILGQKTAISVKKQVNSKIPGKN